MPEFKHFDFTPFRGDDLLLAFLGKIDVAALHHAVALRIECSEGAANPGGKVHGGALSALFDVAFYELAKRELMAEAVTISLEVKFLQAAEPAKPLFAMAQVLRASRALVSCTGAIFQDDRLVAHASGQFLKVTS